MAGVVAVPHNTRLRAGTAPATAGQAHVEPTQVCPVVVPTETKQTVPAGVPGPGCVPQVRAVAGFARPQLLLSLVGLKQRAVLVFPAVPLQVEVAPAVPAVQRHWLFTQVRPPATLQTTPQPPQLLLSTRVLVQVGPVPDGQTALFKPEQPQTPKPPWFWQVVPVESQSLPQLPQFWLFALRMTSQPLVGSLSQFAVPGLHTRMQEP